MQRADFPAVPAVDDRVVEPEAGTELIGGEIRKALPAEPPHADEQCNIAYVIRSDVAPGYAASTELLTRVDAGADFATDACIRKVGRDPETGSRYLEEISFEVKHKQSQADITARARQLIGRGVRRVFVIHVREDAQGMLHAGPVKEWLARQNDWFELPPHAEIVDRCLSQPVKIQALIDATEADNHVARTLLARNNAVLAEDRRKALEAQKSELGQAHKRELEARIGELGQAHQRELEARIGELGQAHRRELAARIGELGQAHQRELAARAETHARDMQARAIQAILDLCDALAIEVATGRRARMNAMTSDELDALRSAIRARRRWPEDL
jgi:hypothetical protein